MDHSTDTLSIAAAVSIEDLSVRVFADGADLAGCRELAANPLIQGFTTNPTLMHKAGVTDYVAFARDVLQLVGHRPISFEVFSDDWSEMERQARLIATWGDNVYVKIPVTDERGESSEELVARLAGGGVKLNVTGLFTVGQVERVAQALDPDVPANISVFAGRIADTGVDPVPIMQRSLELIAAHAPMAELIWASPREVLNIVQADQIGCHIITVTHDLLKKLPLLGRDLTGYSLETVRMFHSDARAAGFRL